ncbi:MAG: hypothetical protein DRQ55_16850, partial [Planctomycetota bacterium]
MRGSYRRPRPTIACEPHWALAGPTACAPCSRQAWSSASIRAAQSRPCPRRWAWKPRSTRVSCPSLAALV